MLATAESDHMGARVAFFRPGRRREGRCAAGWTSAVWVGIAGACWSAAAIAGGSVQATSFGQTPQGEAVTLFVCTNDTGSVLKLMDYGAIVVGLEVPDRQGKLANVTLGFDQLAGYLGGHPFFGATVGRYGNRIGQARFTLDGQVYQLAANNNAHHLHGGTVGFDKYVWQAEPVEKDDAVGVRFTRTSPDGEEGYPGNLQVTAEYLLTNNNELTVQLMAETDQKTHCNLTNHCYWNLHGDGEGTIEDHELQILADKYLPVDEGLIPTGELADVAETPFDFREPHAVGQRLRETGLNPPGYDHCYVLRNQSGKLALAARVKSPRSGRVMEIYTTQPGVQFYSGNFLDGGAANGGYPQYAALCLETQHFPDSPNRPDFPSTVLQPNQKYLQVTVHRFLVE